MQEHLIHIKQDFRKKDITSIANQIVEDYLNNGTDIIKVADMMAKIEFLIKEIKADSRYIDYLYEELNKYPKGKYQTANGTKIETSENGTRYDYGNCNDNKINALLKQQAEIEKEIEKRKEFLFTCPIEGLKVVDEETGEVEVLYPPIKSSKSSYKVTIAK